MPCWTKATVELDLTNPDAEEREAIWKIYTKKYSVKDERPENDG